MSSSTSESLGLLSEAQLAERLGINRRTLLRWRQKRTGPAYVRLGKLLFYRVDAVNAWIASNEVEQPRAVGSRGRR